MKSVKMILLEVDCFEKNWQVADVHGNRIGYGIAV